MQMKRDRTRALDLAPPAERGYRVLLAVDESARAEHLIRRLVQRNRGDLLAMERCGFRRHARLHLRLGGRRIHDVITSLEAAGFAVSALVAT